MRLTQENIAYLNLIKALQIGQITWFQYFEAIKRLKS